jgi:hypothetical protein
MIGRVIVGVLCFVGGRFGNAAAACTKPGKKCQSNDECCGKKRACGRIGICAGGRRCCGRKGAACASACDCCNLLLCDQGLCV